MTAREWYRSDAVFQMRWKNAHPDSKMSTEDQVVAVLEAYHAHESAQPVNIGDVRRRLFIPGTDEWNGVVRDVTAKLEQPGEHVDEAKVLKELAAYLKNRVFAKQLSSDMAQLREAHPFNKGYLNCPFCGKQLEIPSSPPSLSGGSK